MGFQARKSRETRRRDEDGSLGNGAGKLGLESVRRKEMMNPLEFEGMDGEESR